MKAEGGGMKKKRKKPSSKAEHPLLRVDRTAFSVVSLEDAGDDRAYWASKTPQERMAALELVREVLYGYRGTRPGLQRVLEVVEREVR